MSENIELYDVATSRGLDEQLDADIEARRVAREQERERLAREELERQTAVSRDNRQAMLANQEFERQCNETYWQSVYGARAAFDRHDLEGAISAQLRALAVKELQSSQR